MNKYLKKTGFIYLLVTAGFVLVLSPNKAWSAEMTGQLPKAAADEIVVATADTADSASDEDSWSEEDNWDEEWGEEETIADPLEPLNRLFFRFNDRLYYWVLKPVARAYSAVVPEDIQIAFRNFFENLKTPTRAVNSLLQGQPRDFSVEVARFFLNSTAGVAGFGDAAKDVWGLESTKEDTGQTFGYYGAGGGFYINWPFLGPSNLRDSIGMVGDAFLHPFAYLDSDWDKAVIGAQVFERINRTALSLGDYELFTETALDPYAAVKDAYEQYRNGLIKE